MQAVLRDYSPADFETLHAIDQVCYPRGIAYSRQTLRWFLALPDADCLVAQADRTPDAAMIGFIIAEAEESEGHIITLDVVSERRRAGVGTALVREMEKRLEARGVRRMALETATSNESAVAFWQSHGYRTQDVLRGYYLGRTDAYLMLKDLVHPPA